MHNLVKVYDLMSREGIAPCDSTKGEKRHDVGLTSPKSRRTTPKKKTR